nr:MoaD/ThiS family protein [Granulicella tundricola]
MHLDVGSRVGGLVRDLAGRSSKSGEGLGGMMGSIAVAVNREYAGMETVLNDGDEVALLPPVSGGCCAG